jgi:hypothetical protein
MGCGPSTQRRLTFEFSVNKRRTVNFRISVFLLLTRTGRYTPHTSINPFCLETAGLRINFSASNGKDLTGRTESRLLLWNVSILVGVPGYRSRDPGSIHGATRFFWEVVGLERGPLSLVSTTEEILGRKSSGSGLESRKYSSRDPSRCPRSILYPQKLALTSPTSGGHPVGIVCSLTRSVLAGEPEGKILQGKYIDSG